MSEAVAATQALPTTARREGRTASTARIIVPPTLPPAAAQTPPAPSPYDYSDLDHQQVHAALEAFYVCKNAVEQIPAMLHRLGLFAPAELDIPSTVAQLQRREAAAEASRAQQRRRLTASKRDSGAAAAAKGGDSSGAVDLSVSSTRSSPAPPAAAAALPPPAPHPPVVFHHQPHGVPPEAFLHIVNLIVKDINKRTSEDAEIANAYEALGGSSKKHNISPSSQQQPSTSNAGGAPRLRFVGGDFEITSASSSVVIPPPGSPTDPLASNEILNKIVSPLRGVEFAEFRRELETTKENPKIIRAFLRIGAKFGDTGKLTLESDALMNRCEQMGFDDSEARIVLNYFDEDINGDIDFYEFKRAMFVDISDLNPAVVECMRRLLGYEDVTPRAGGALALSASTFRVVPMAEGGSSGTRNGGCGSAKRLRGKSLFHSISHTQDYEDEDVMMDGEDFGEDAESDDAFVLGAGGVSSSEREAYALKKLQRQLERCRDHMYKDQRDTMHAVRKLAAQAAHRDHGARWGGGGAHQPGSVPSTATSTATDTSAGGGGAGFGSEPNSHHRRASDAQQPHQPSSSRGSSRDLTTADDGKNDNEKKKKRKEKKNPFLEFRNHKKYNFQYVYPQLSPVKVPKEPPGESLLQREQFGLPSIFPLHRHQHSSGQGGSSSGTAARGEEQHPPNEEDNKKKEDNPPEPADETEEEHKTAPESDEDDGQGEGQKKQNEEEAVPAAEDSQEDGEATKQQPKKSKKKKQQPRKEKEEKEHQDRQQRNKKKPEGSVGAMCENVLHKVFHSSVNQPASLDDPQLAAQFRASMLPSSARLQQNQDDDTTPRPARRYLHHPHRSFYHKARFVPRLPSLGLPYEVNRILEHNNEVKEKEQRAQDYHDIVAMKNTGTTPRSARSTADGGSVCKYDVSAQTAKKVYDIPQPRTAR